MSRFNGKVALVTGATGGIGRATAIAFAKEGAQVVVTGRRREQGEETVALIRQAGGEGHFVQADAAVEADAERTVAEAIRVFGGLDIAFNNAGVEQMPGPLTATTEAVYDQIMDTNVKGVLFSMKHQVPALLARGGGVIVNNASVAGLVGMGGIAVYVASKHAVIGLTKSAALEFAKQNIRVNAVAPGGVETPMFDRFLSVVSRDAMNAMHPIGRTGTPDEIAAGVLFLADPHAAFVTGHTLVLDGGFTAQ